MTFGQPDLSLLGVFLKPRPRTGRAARRSGLVASADNPREALPLVEFMVSGEGKRIFIHSGVV